MVSPDKPASCFTLYPNPAADEVTIGSNAETGNVSIRIFKSNGRCVYNDEYNDTNFRVETSAFLPGLYFVMISSASSTEVKKMVVL